MTEQENNILDITLECIGGGNPPVEHLVKKWQVYRKNRRYFYNRKKSLAWRIRHNTKQ